MKVSVFGGAGPKPGEPAYIDAMELGNLLGKAGHTVLTGGYIGTMEAVSRGAAEAGGHVIGVTCDEIERWRPVKANAWVKEEWKYTSLSQRLEALVDNCDAAMALPGGVGTLAEVVMLWNKILIQAIQPRPVILIGKGWQETFDALHKGQRCYIHEKDWQWLIHAGDVKEALTILDHLSEK
jgi:uncharacterized protein (TIGR00730 family)